MESDTKIFPLRNHLVYERVRFEVRLAKKALGKFISYLMRVYNLL